VKKRIILCIIIAISLALSLIACTPKVSVPIVPEGPAPLSLERDLGVYVDGTWFPILQDAEALLTALGSDYTMEIIGACVYQGDDKIFIYADCMVFTNPNGVRDIWHLIKLDSDNLSTSRDIRVGMTLDELTAAYGTAFYGELGDDIVLVYSISGVEEDEESPFIRFVLDGDIITYIEICYPTNDFS